MKAHTHPKSPSFMFVSTRLASPAQVNSICFLPDSKKSLKVITKLWHEDSWHCCHNSRFLEAEASYLFSSNSLPCRFSICLNAAKPACFPFHLKKTFKARMGENSNARNFFQTLKDIQSNNARHSVQETFFQTLKTFKATM